MKTISKYSFGIGDRFAHEGVNQLKALIAAEKKFGVHFTPVWNKSNREHTIIGTEPMSTRREADEAVKTTYRMLAGEELSHAERLIDAGDKLEKTPEEEYLWKFERERALSWWKRIKHDIG